ncbi:MAG: hypothetical protein MJK04_15240 [Psychrosphaera sp.]|nr:hypothetical protein [Psychrosphaera sp.]
MKPDFSQYTYFELMEALESVDRDAYPERVTEIRNELEHVAARFPYVKVPSDSIEKMGDHHGIWHKLTHFVTGEQTIKEYGNIEAYISRSGEISFSSHATTAALVDDRGHVKFVLHGHHNDQEIGMQIKMGPAGVKKLRDVLTHVIEDMERVEHMVEEEQQQQQK